MMPSNFPGTNKLSDDNALCIPVAFLRDRGLDGLWYITTLWIPSTEDIMAINAGRGILMKTQGREFPPVTLFTIDENGKANL